MEEVAERKFAVLGSPIDHSLSPFIHTCFAKQFNLPIIYQALNVAEKNFLEQLSDLQTRGFLGVNITTPLKTLAFHESTDLSDRARHAQAVNTISFRSDATIFGDNTDGIGVVRDLSKNNYINLHGKKVLILGAGGATRGILRPILTLDPALVMIANRTRPKAIELAEYFKPWGKVRACDLSKLKRSSFDVVIHATSAGLKGETPELPGGFSLQNSICYDLSYGDIAKPFIALSRKLGATKSIDGLGMLVEQAAEAFFQWNQLRPNTELVITETRSHLRKASEE